MAGVQRSGRGPRGLKGYQRFGVDSHVDLPDHVVEDPSGALNDRHRVAGGDLGETINIESVLHQRVTDDGRHVEQGPTRIGEGTEIEPGGSRGRNTHGPGRCSTEVRIPVGQMANARATSGHGSGDAGCSGAAVLQLCYDGIEGVPVGGGDMAPGLRSPLGRFGAWSRQESASCRSDNSDSQNGGTLGHPTIVCDDPREFVAEFERSSQVECVQAAEKIGLNHCGSFAHSR